MRVCVCHDAAVSRNKQARPDKHVKELDGINENKNDLRTKVVPVGSIMPSNINSGSFPVICHLKHANHSPANMEP